MAKDSGWIKLHRSLLEWEWYTDANTKVLFLHLILKANYQDHPWHGIIVRRGQLVTSINHLSEETGISVQNVRTALSHLKKSGEITCRSTNKYTIITIENYGLYQDVGEDTNKQIAIYQHSNNNN